MQAAIRTGIVGKAIYIIIGLAIAGPASQQEGVAPLILQAFYIAEPAAAYVAGTRANTAC